MAETINQQIVDALTVRQLRIGRVETRQRHEIWAMLALLEAELVAAIKVADPTEFVLLHRRQQVVEELMEELGPLITTRYDRIEGRTTAMLVQLAIQEAEAVQRIVNGATEDETDEETLPLLPSDAAIRRVVTETRIPTPQRPTDPSATTEEWWERQAESLTERLRDQLLVSVSLEESLTDMTNRLRGTPEMERRDGLMERARQDASRLLATAVTNAIGEAHVAVADRNVRQMPTGQMVLEHVSVLDSRTSTTCLARHGKRYSLDTHESLGHSIPYLNGVPYHPN